MKDPWNRRNCVIKKVVKEEVRWGTGLISKIIFKCTACPNEYSYFTEDPKKERSKINFGAVWGTLAVGSTYGHLEEFLSVIDVPPLTLYKFKQIENELANAWKDSFFSDMEENGKEERKRAIKAGQIDTDGTPYTTVYLDGGWSKRSYGHSYNASSGTAIIVGKLSGKLLYLGVRNKYCSICARAANKQIPIGQHVCYKNWSGSSSSMEADIVVEGFCRSQEMHGIRYKYFIADEDSSVYAKIRAKVPYGEQVQKVECTNHVIKNFGKALRFIKNDKNVHLQARKLLTGKIIEELGNRVQNAIYDNALGDVESLKADVVNSPYHVFKDHRSCRDIYCEDVGKLDENLSNSLRNSGLLLHIKGALDNVLKKSHKLISNETNNRAELYMAILARFNAGKRLNLTQRGSFETRSHLAGLRYDKGTSWHYSPWRNVIGESPGSHFKEYMIRQKRSREMKTEHRKNTTPYKKDLMVPTEQPNFDYGPNAEEGELTKEEFDSEVNRRLHEFQITGKDDQDLIANETLGQFDNHLYINRRKHRLTASIFGQVVKRLPTTPCHNLVKQILMPAVIKNSRAMEYGKNSESMVRERFSRENNIPVKESGLYIDLDRGYLAASPDGKCNDDYYLQSSNSTFIGLIGTDGLIEIKCLWKISQERQSLMFAVKNKVVPCLELNSDGNISLKRNHNYYFQVQGQLNITNRKYCKFIVYSGDNNPLFIENIERDHEFRMSRMVPKLEKFYLDCVLPEIVRGNLQKHKLCIDPPYISEAIRKREEEKQVKLK
ncbi:hypothetical protein PPYR_04657 [Photinus pyralis]|uniref:Uncharacterized protein n=1 Tax=Photinus pyralis TaxID=7054 RepID=A0A5N4AYN8_PHOPY|nr:hypothetical protein PPYR_04657 [Photinus pyralis]